LKVDNRRNSEEITQITLFEVYSVMKVCKKKGRLLMIVPEDFRTVITPERSGKPFYTQPKAPAAACYFIFEGLWISFAPDDVCPYLTT
jgi:hypothetical protein